MISYEAIALNRELRRVLVRSGTLEDCRDAVHEHYRASPRSTSLRWATGYYGLVGITEDGESALSPFVVRYLINVLGEPVA